MNRSRSMAVSGQFQYKKLSRQMAVSTGKKNGKQFQPPPISKQNSKKQVLCTNIISFTFGSKPK